MSLTLPEIAKRVLNEEGQDVVAIHLKDGRKDLAQAYILGAIDRLWEDCTLNDEEAKEYYNNLGVPGETAAQLRQNRRRN